MTGADRRYVFAPLEQRHALAGLRAGQVTLVGGGLVVGTLLLRRSPDAVGVAGAAVILVAALLAAFVPVSGRSLGDWARPVARHGARHLRRATDTRPGAGRGGVGRAGAVMRVAPAPPAFASLRFDESRAVGGQPVGRIEDRRNGCTTAVIAVRGSSFALLDGAEKVRRLDAWAGVLVGLSREDGPVRSLTWVHRTVPGDAEALTRHLRQHASLPVESAAYRSYAELAADAGPLLNEHQCLVALTVRPPRRHARATAEGALLRELRLLEGQLRSAELDVDHVLSLREIGGLLRTAFDPWAATDVARRAAFHADLPGPLPDSAWPAATKGGWASWMTDGAWHATFWIAEWPRIDVGADFLGPLLLDAGAQRRVAVVMAPLPPSAGIREAEAARTARVADDHLRERAGFLATARRRREADGVARREAELSNGHAAYRFSGYITVTAASAEALEVAAGEVVQAAHRSRLELRRLFGAQDAAFTWTLPLGRGIAVR